MLDEMLRTLLPDTAPTSVELLARKIAALEARVAELERAERERQWRTWDALPTIDERPADAALWTCAGRVEPPD